MRFRWTPLAVVCMAAAPLFAPAQSANTDPTVVVRMKSVEGVIDDLKYVFANVGQEDAANQIDGLIQAQNPAGLGVDTTKAIGLYAFITPGGIDSTVVGLIPVSDEKKLVNTLGGFGAKAEKGKDGVYTVDAPGLQLPVFFVVADGYAFVTVNDKAPLASDVRLKPAKVLAGDPTTVVGLKLNIDAIPKEGKQMFLGYVENMVADLKEKKRDGETPDQAKARAQGIDAAMGVLKMVVTDGGATSFDFNVDQKKGKLGLGGSLAGVANSGLAGIISTFGSGPSLFASVRGDAVNAHANLSVPAMLKLPLAMVVDQVVKDALAKETDEAKRAAAKKLLDAVVPTIKAGELDVAMSFFTAAGTRDQFKVLAGMKVKDGKQIEAAVKDVVAGVPAKDKQDITLDAATVAGAAVHRIKLPAGDAESQRMFGTDATLDVAFRADAVVAALGTQTADLIKTGLQSVAGVVTPVGMDIAFAKASGLAPQSDRTAQEKMAREVFGADAKGGDLFSATVEGGAALKVQVSVGTPTLKFFSKLNEEKKNK